VSYSIIWIRRLWLIYHFEATFSIPYAILFQYRLSFMTTRRHYTLCLYFESVVKLRLEYIHKIVVSELKEKLKALCMHCCDWRSTTGKGKTLEEIWAIPSLTYGYYTCQLSKSEKANRNKKKFCSLRHFVCKRLEFMTYLLFILGFENKTMSGYFAWVYIWGIPLHDVHSCQVSYRLVFLKSNEKQAYTTSVFRNSISHRLYIDLAKCEF